LYKTAVFRIVYGNMTHQQQENSGDNAQHISVLQFIIIIIIIIIITAEL